VREPDFVEIAAPETIQVCAFYVGAQQYVLDLRRVKEILQPPPVTPLPRAPAYLEGVVHLRGEVVPVVDLRKRLPAGAPPPHAKAKMLVCLLGRRKLALIVDGVAEVVRVELSRLKPAPAIGGMDAPYVLGVCEAPNGLRLMLDLRALLTR
jgi:purine-binding chemotaxis protein CheW